MRPFWPDARDARDCVVLMGDLNSGPLLPSDPESAELPANFDLLLAAGWIEPWHECTVCKGNELAETDTPNKQIDHIMLSPSCEQTSIVYDRVFEQPPPLSDHFGLRARISRAF